MLGIPSTEKYKGFILFDKTTLTPKSLRIRKRDLLAVDSIVLHQTAVSRAYDNPRLLLTCSHYLVLLNGEVWKLHGHDDYLYSANSFNRRSISIEVAGNFEGNSGVGDWYHPEKFGKDKLTADAVKGLRLLLTYLVQDSALTVKYIFAHRQSGISSKTKRPNRPLDPGEEIWRECGNWGVHVLGLSDGGEGFKSQGLPIPSNWKLPPQIVPM